VVVGTGGIVTVGLRRRFNQIDNGRILNGVRDIPMARSVLFQQFVAEYIREDGSRGLYAAQGKGDAVEAFDRIFSGCSGRGPGGSVICAADDEIDVQSIRVLEGEVLFAKSLAYVPLFLPG